MSGTMQLSVVGVRAAHGDGLQGSLADASRIMPRLGRNAKRIYLGGWNVDQLPNLPRDSRALDTLRWQHHMERRELLDT